MAALRPGSANLPPPAGKDGSVAGNWHLPNIRELQSLVHYGANNPARSNVNGDGKAGSPDDPFTGFWPGFYWSSTSNAENPFNVWDVFFDKGKSESV
jgi:hypothetical protein